MWNAISNNLDLNLCRRIYFLPLHHGHLLDSELSEFELQSRY